MITRVYFSRYKKGDKPCVRDAEKNLPVGKDLNCIERATKQILIFMVNRYIFLHKMDNLFIDLKHKSIFYKTNQRREPILKMGNGAVKNYSLEDETYERLIGILKRKENIEDDLGTKIAVIESNVIILGQQLEIVKSCLEKIVLKICNE